MNGDRPMVANAADPKQVKHAGRKERDRRKRELDDWRAVMATPQGRRVLWYLIRLSGYSESPSHQRGDVTNQKIGRADMGRLIISEMGHAGGIEPWLEMQRQAWKEKQSDEIEAEAIRSPSALDNQADS